MTLAFVSLAWAAHPAATTKKAPPKGVKSTKFQASKNSSAKAAPVRKAATWRNRQMAPTPDRYRQIQEALVAKGYLQPEKVTGVWNSDSVDALKRFQGEQNISSTGKINALSLIALGLGPRHDSPPPKPAAPPAQ